MIFEQNILIKAPVTTVESFLTDLELMHRWLNPILRCEGVGEWSTEIGSQSVFIIQTPLWQPTLHSVVIERKPGLIIWQFSGFFQGCDRWQCQETEAGTNLVNRFEFSISNPLVSWGFRHFAAGWTKKDMKAQLERLKSLAEQLA